MVFIRAKYRRAMKCWMTVGSDIDGTGHITSQTTRHQLTVADVTSPSALLVITSDCDNYAVRLVLSTHSASHVSQITAHFAGVLIQRRRTSPTPTGMRHRRTLSGCWTNPPKTTADAFCYPLSSPIIQLYISKLTAQFCACTDRWFCMLPTACSTRFYSIDFVFNSRSICLMYDFS